jgi:serine/threonine protein kinase
MLESVQYVRRKPLTHSSSSSRCVTIQILGKSASKAEDCEIPNHIEAILKKDEEAKDYALMPLEIFWEDQKVDRYLCTVTELYGPHLQRLIDEEEPSASIAWIRKVFQEALEALEFLHTRGIIHGGLFSPLLDLVGKFLTVKCSNDSLVLCTDISISR